MKFNKLTVTALLLAIPSLVMGGKGPASSSASLSPTQESHPIMLNQSKQPAPKPGIANTSRPPTRKSHRVVWKDVVAFNGIEASVKDVQVSMVILQSFYTHDRALMVSCSHLVAAHYHFISGHHQSWWKDAWKI